MGRPTELAGTTGSIVCSSSGCRRSSWTTNFLSSTGWQWGRPVVEVDAIDGAVDIIFL
jgi:hypothetical protein